MNEKSWTCFKFVDSEYKNFKVLKSWFSFTRNRSCKENKGLGCDNEHVQDLLGKEEILIKNRI